MKYWTLFTLQMIARLGLAMVIVSWVCTRWVHLDCSIPTGPITVVASAGHNGWLAGCLLSRIGPPEWFEVGNPENEAERIHVWYPTVIDTGIGIAYREKFISGGHLLQFSHPFLCMSFLIATVVTSWKRRQPDASAAELNAVNAS